MEWDGTTLPAYGHLRRRGARFYWPGWTAWAPTRDEVLVEDDGASLLT